MNNDNIYTTGIADNYDLAQHSKQNFRKYDDHITDTTIHVTEDDKSRWNKSTDLINVLNITIILVVIVYTNK